MNLEDFAWDAYHSKEIREKGNLTNKEWEAISDLIFQGIIIDENILKSAKEKISNIS